MIANWEDAEQLAVNYMRCLGWSNASLTVMGADGGLDAIAGNAGAQVKFLAKPVGSPDVQRLRGAAHGMGYALFFSNSGYTNSAQDVADATGVALFGYNSDELVYPANDAARELAKRAGLDAASLNELQLTLARAEELMGNVDAQRQALIELCKNNGEELQAEAIALKESGSPSSESVSRLERKYVGAQSDAALLAEVNRLYKSSVVEIGVQTEQNNVAGIIEVCERTLKEFNNLGSKLSCGIDDLIALTEKHAEALRSRPASSASGSLHMDLVDAVGKMRERQRVPS